MTKRFGCKRPGEAPAVCVPVHVKGASCLTRYLVEDVHCLTLCLAAVQRIPPSWPRARRRSPPPPPPKRVRISTPGRLSWRVMQANAIVGPDCPQTNTSRSCMQANTDGYSPASRRQRQASRHNQRILSKPARAVASVPAGARRQLLATTAVGRAATQDPGLQAAHTSHTTPLLSCYLCHWRPRVPPPSPRPTGTAPDHGRQHEGIQCYSCIRDCRNGACPWAAR